MAKETAALGLTLAVHLVAFGVLVWAMLGDEGSDWRSWWPRDERPGADPPAPQPDGSRPGGLPLPHADPAAARLRTEHDRVAEPGRRRVRRPAHEPERERDPIGSTG